MHAQDKYGFKARVFQAKGFDTKQDYQKVHGSDLYITDTDKYDQICKARTLSTHSLARPFQAEFTHVPVGVAAHKPVHHGRVCYLERPGYVCQWSPGTIAQGRLSLTTLPYLHVQVELSQLLDGYSWQVSASVCMGRWSPSAAPWQSWTWTA